MANNIEIKAKIQNFDVAIAKAKEISASEGLLIIQHDTFFHSSTGRLKLREFPDGTAQLISYLRPDSLEPSVCDYHIYSTDSAEALRTTLMMTLGSRGEVKKKRHLFLYGRTRIHIDDVNDLGHFLELEVVLEVGEDQAQGFIEAEELIQILGVSKEDLIRGAYIDMLSN